MKKTVSKANPRSGNHLPNNRHEPSRAANSSITTPVRRRHEDKSADIRDRFFKARNPDTDLPFGLSAGW